MQNLIELFFVSMNHRFAIVRDLQEIKSQTVEHSAVIAAKIGRLLESPLGILSLVLGLLLHFRNRQRENEIAIILQRITRSLHRCRNRL